MSGAWIKVRTVLPTDGRLRIASRKCHASTVTCFGALVTLWCLADSHGDENGVLNGYTADDVDALIGVPGFCNSLPSDWIDLSGEFVKLPDYQQHNGSTGKSRSQATKRKTLSRSNRDTSVTREEKKREEKNKNPIVPSGDVLDAGLWAEFVAHRKQIGKPLTDLAATRMVEKLAKLKASGVDVKAAVDDSIRNGWQDVFAPKAGTKPATGTPWDGAL
jgi:hypothetical protein